MITDNKRAFKRSKRKFTVEYRKHGVSDAPCASAVSENISLGGVYIVSLERFDIGQQLDCVIIMPGSGRKGKWLARVVRCEEISDGMVRTFGVAAEFVRASGEAEKDLREVLED
jgi:hypothetical protein